MISNDIDIGTRVVNKRVGLPAVGKVIAIVDFGFYQDWYCKNNGRGIDTGRSWQEHYPDWRKQRMVGVKYDNPIHTEPLETYAEIMRTHAQVHLSEEEILYGYERSKTDTRFYPEEDLEVFD